MSTINKINKIYIGKFDSKEIMYDISYNNDSWGSRYYLWRTSLPKGHFVMKIVDFLVKYYVRPVILILFDFDIVTPPVYR
jgi:hypothetical protein